MLFSSWESCSWDGHLTLVLCWLVSKATPDPFLFCSPSHNCLSASLSSLPSDWNPKVVGCLFISYDSPFTIVSQNYKFFLILDKIRKRFMCEKKDVLMSASQVA